MPSSTINSPNTNNRHAAKGIFREAIESVRAFFSMLRDPQYHFPRRVRWLSLFALFYVLSPIDLIPDFIPMLGFVDDVSMFTGLAMLIWHEIVTYRQVARARVYR